MGALHKFLSMHYLRIDVAEFGGHGGGGAELPPVVDNDLVTITPVLLEACGADQARPCAAWREAVLADASLRSMERGCVS